MCTRRRFCTDGVQVVKDGNQWYYMVQMLRDGLSDHAACHMKTLVVLSQLFVLVVCAARRARRA